MTTTEIVLLGFCAVLIGTLVLMTVLFFRALQRAADFADSLHIRSQGFQDNLLDRLMAVDYTSYKAYRSADEAAPGGWEGPEPEPTLDLEDRIDDGEPITVTGLHLERRGGVSG